MSHFTDLVPPDTLSVPQGIAIVSRGPTLQDLKDRYDTDVSTLSRTFAANAAGGILGAITSEPRAERKE